MSLIDEIKIPALIGTFGGTADSIDGDEFTASLTVALVAIRDAIAASPKARDGVAPRHLEALAEALRSAGV